jgi:hypothetical protein
MTLRLRMSSASRDEVASSLFTTLTETAPLLETINPLQITYQCAVRVADDAVDHGRAERALIHQRLGDGNPPRDVGWSTQWLQNSVTSRRNSRATALLRAYPALRAQNRSALIARHRRTSSLHVLT